MALILQQPGIQPLGQFDGLDTVATSTKGGEVGTITSTFLTSGDLASSDANGSDGYVGNPAKRPVVTINLVSGNRPLFLIDDGIAGYGTIFGSVVGGTVGQVVTGGAVLGPHTATGSGKLTCWDKPGLYAVTLDAVDTTASTGLVPTNATLAIGDKLYAKSSGLLTPAVGSSFESSLAIARFIDFQTNGSLVRTPNYLVSALNSPSGAVSSVQLLAETQAIFYFAPPIA